MSLGNRLTLWILCFPLLVLFVAVVFVLQQDTEWRKSALRERVITAAEQQAPELARAMAEEAEGRLDSMARRLLEIDEAHGVGIYTDNGMFQLELGRNRAQVATSPPNDTVLDTRGDLWRLMVPLAPAEGAWPGQAWLELDIDSRALTLDYYRRLATAGLGLLLLGLLLFLIGSTLGRRVDASLNDTAEALRRLRSGDLEARVPEEGAPELRRLARHVNALGDEMQQSRENMRRQIEQTTAELEESMETIEIKNIELDLAHRRALEANRIKSEFLASMSHEIRTPLNGIVGFCRLLGRSRLEPRQREWLDQVHVACDNLLALVNDVLDFSRMEAGRLELDRAELDMVSLVDEALGLQAPLAHQKGLHLLGLVYDDVPSPLRGDPLRIRQVLTNLTHNALKFTEKGEVIVRVMVEEQSEQGHVLLRISISDTGIGLTTQEQHNLFQAFRQATASHSRQYGGSGLGLAISRQLVEQMGGQITVESEPSQGSTFSFTLPLDVVGSGEVIPEVIFDGDRVALYEPHAPTRHALSHLLTLWGGVVEEASQPDLSPPYPALWVAALPAELNDTVIEEWRERLQACPCPVLLLVNVAPLEVPELNLPSGCEILSKPASRQALADALRRCNSAKRRPAPMKERTSCARVMVVDDNAINRRLLQELLQRPNLEVVEAESGEEALALAEGAPFQLVLMDIRMPGMDGIETTQALRRLDERWKHCPIVAVTAHAHDSERQKLYAAGMQEVLVKPVDSNQLEALLQRHLGQVAPLPAPSPALAAPASRESVVASDLAVVDMALGTRLANGNESLAHELLEELVASLPKTLEELRSAIATEDPEALLDAVHALNGACRYCGAPELALTAETLETRLRSRGMAKVDPLIDELFQAIERLREWHAQGQDELPGQNHAGSASSRSD
ncbi:response regulator [Billgrantia kenyensis]|uniref:histidine kinase n=1 Tax=Billgrantia kenyensis TaxID=321266 RepID=A0A7W0AD22_9GAMM|nr:response regulator [Halomonas kenyensis]MBA2778553.1 response regulator [Halomonas kenyensis]MCG6661642.1 response regulator [Halomonas kenyensis]